jgi:signal transduction histidine kinase
MRHRLLTLTGFAPMAHRPPLPPRWQLYCVVAFLAPPILLQLIPASDVGYRDLVWLLTLVPAFLLSLQYGMRGAVAGLTMGTVLFTVIQFLVAARLDPEDWRVTVPIYIAYSAIAISVGWLSEQLHLFYERAMVGERVAVITQLAIGMRHDINNALATVMAEAQLLEGNDKLTSPEDRESLRLIVEMVRRVHDSVERLTTLTAAPPVREYALGTTMIDLEGMRRAPPSPPAPPAPAG